MLKTFLKRLSSSVVLIGIFCCALFLRRPLSDYFFLFLLMFGSYFSAYEFSDILKKGGKHCSPVIAGLCVMIPLDFLFLYSHFYAQKFGIFLLLIVFFIFLLIPFLAFFLLLFSKQKMEFLDSVLNTSSVFLILIIPFFMMLVIYFESRMLFLFFILATKIGDIGAYVVGSLSHVITKGRNHKLIPSISPGKSWEGFIGGWIITIIFVYFLFPCVTISKSVSAFLLADTLQLKIILILLGTGFFLFGAAGDLAESSLKRTCNVKDSGHIIPGIGGVLDLFDSLLLNAPLFTLFLFALKYLTF